MFYFELLGFLGGALITLGFIPQILRLFRLKSAQEISIPFTVLFLAGGVCWLIYGILLSLPPVVLWNVVTIVLLTILMYAKIKYRRINN